VRVCRTVCLFTPQAYAGTNLYCLVTEAVRVNNLPKVALDKSKDQHHNHYDTEPRNKSKYNYYNDKKEK